MKLESGGVFERGLENFPELKIVEKKQASVETEACYHFAGVVPVICLKHREK